MKILVNNLDDFNKNIVEEKLFELFEQLQNYTASKPSIKIVNNSFQEFTSLNRQDFKGKFNLKYHIETTDSNVTIFLKVEHIEYHVQMNVSKYEIENSKTKNYGSFTNNETMQLIFDKYLELASCEKQDNLKLSSQKSVHKKNEREIKDQKDLINYFYLVQTIRNNKEKLNVLKSIMKYSLETKSFEFPKDLCSNIFSTINLNELDYKASFLPYMMFDR